MFVFDTLKIRGLRIQLAIMHGKMWMISNSPKLHLFVPVKSRIDAIKKAHYFIDAVEKYRASIV